MIIEVKVKPNSSKFKIEFKNGNFLIFCKSTPEKNQANIEIIKEIKKIFEKDVKIVKGFKSKNKVIEIEGLDREEFLKYVEKVN